MDTLKTAILGKFIALRAYEQKWRNSSFPFISRTERSKLSRLGRRQEIIKVSSGMNKIETNEQYKYNETRIWFLEKISKICKPLSKLDREKVYSN